jgi:predicted nucleic acid-binding protein
VRFFDASALVKRYVREPHSAAVRRLLATGPVAISRLSEVEVVSGLARLERESAITSRMRDRAVAAFAKDLAAWHIVELSNEVALLARALLLRHSLRSGDAIQLASALRIQQIALQPLAAFIAYDARLNAAAIVEGLTTISG